MSQNNPALIVPVTKANRPGLGMMGVSSQTFTVLMRAPITSNTWLPLGTDFSHARAAEVVEEDSAEIAMLVKANRLDGNEQYPREYQILEVRSSVTIATTLYFDGPDRPHEVVGS